MSIELCFRMHLTSSLIQPAFDCLKNEKKKKKKILLFYTCENDYAVFSLDISTFICLELIWLNFFIRSATCINNICRKYRTLWVDNKLRSHMTFSKQTYNNNPDKLSINYTSIITVNFIVIIQTRLMYILHRLPAWDALIISYKNVLPHIIL